MAKGELSVGWTRDLEDKAWMGTQTCLELEADVKSDSAETDL